MDVENLESVGRDNSVATTETYKPHFQNRLKKGNTFYCSPKFHLIRHMRFCPGRPTNCRIPRNLSLHKRNHKLDRTCFVLSRSSKISCDSMHKSIEIGKVARIVIGVSSYYQYPKSSTYMLTFKEVYFLERK